MKIADRFGCHWHKNSQQIAVIRNSVECLKLAYIHDGCWSYGLTDRAAGFGALECLKYLHESGCEWTKQELNLAVAGRHMPCVKYLHEEQGSTYCTFNSNLFRRILLILFSVVTWNEYTCEWAAKGEELLDSTFDYIDRYVPVNQSAECLQYVHERGGTR